MPVCDLAISKRANAGVAQRQRQRTQNPYSASSNLAPGTCAVDGPAKTKQNRQVDLAQVVEHRSPKPCVRGSSPRVGAERISGIRSEQNRLPLRGFGTVAQLVERPPEERKALGSSPSVATVRRFRVGTRACPVARLGRGKVTGSLARSAALRLLGYLRTRRRYTPTPHFVIVG